MSLDAALSRAAARREPTPVRTDASKSVPAKTLSVFTRQWAALMSAGIPLSQALELLSQSIVGSRATQKSFSESKSTRVNRFTVLFKNTLKSSISITAVCCLRASPQAS